MTLLHPTPSRHEPRAAPRPRAAWADELKVVLVAGVVVGHAAMAWTGFGNWVMFEPPVREPLLTVLVVVGVVGALFAMPLFFLLAGTFTPRSLQRKGLRQFVVDRAIRLGVPIVVFVLVLAPPIEYVDDSNVGFEGGFWAFAPTQWWPWPPAWGPLWFLAVLLVFSFVYAVGRTLHPTGTTGGRPLRWWHLAATALVVALASWVVRLAVPLGDELRHLALGQAPAWIAGFALGVVGAERGWYDPLPRAFARRLGQVAWSVSGAIVVMIGTADALGVEVDAFAGGGTWQSLVMAGLEAILVVTMPLWLIEVFRRRVTGQARLARSAGRAAFAAFVVHQPVLVGCVLATRYVPWAPEAEFVGATLLALVGSFGLGAALLRVPVVARVL